MIERKRLLRPNSLLVAISMIALAISVFNYFWTGNGIHGSIGALLVIVSTLVMALAAEAACTARGPFGSVLFALLLIDILGTGFAAYMLEAEILLGLMVLALVALAWCAVAGARSRSAATLRTVS